MIGSLAIIKENGEIAFEEIIQPEKIADAVTEVSGITLQELLNGKTFEEIKDNFEKVIKNSILVGHGISNDV